MFYILILLLRQTKRKEKKQKTKKQKQEKKKNKHATGYVGKVWPLESRTVGLRILRI